MARRQIGKILGSPQKPKPIPWGKNSWGKLVVEEDEKEKPEAEQRREYTVLGSDLGERDHRVACHASALALAMTNEVCRRTELLAKQSSLLF